MMIVVHERDFSWSEGDIPITIVETTIPARALPDIGAMVDLNMIEEVCEDTPSDYVGAF